MTTERYLTQAALARIQAVLARQVAAREMIRPERESWQEIKPRSKQARLLAQADEALSLRDPTTAYQCLVEYRVFQAERGKPCPSEIMEAIILISDLRYEDIVEANIYEKRYRDVRPSGSGKEPS